MGTHFSHVKEEEITDELMGEFAVLPQEIIYEVLLYCDAEDLGRLSCVNTLFSQVASDNVIWQQLFLRDYGLPHQLRNYTKNELNELPWKELYDKKTNRRMNPYAGPPPPPAPHWSVLMLTALVCICTHLVLLPCVVLMLLVTLLTLSHRALRLGYIIGTTIRDVPAVFTQKEKFLEFLFFRTATNPLLSIYGNTFAEFLMVLFDAICFFLLPYLLWGLCLLTVYRAPFLWRTIKEGVNGIDLSVAVLDQGWSIVCDIFYFFFCFPPILVTWHRVPSFSRRIRALSYSDWKDGTPRKVLSEEANLIFSCKECCLDPPVDIENPKVEKSTTKKKKKKAKAKKKKLRKAKKEKKEKKAKEDKKKEEDKKQEEKKEKEKTEEEIAEEWAREERVESEYETDEEIELDMFKQEEKKEEKKEKEKEKKWESDIEESTSSSEDEELEEEEEKTHKNNVALFASHRSVWATIGLCIGWTFVTVFAGPICLFLLLTLSHHSLQLGIRLYNLATAKKQHSNTESNLYYKNNNNSSNNNSFRPDTVWNLIWNQLFSAFVDAAFLFTPFLCCWVVIISGYRVPLLWERIKNEDRSKQVAACDHTGFVFSQALNILGDFLVFFLCFPLILLTCHRLPSFFLRLRNSASYNEGVRQWQKILWEETRAICTCPSALGGSSQLGDSCMKGIGYLLLLPFGFFAIFCGLFTLITCSHRAVCLVRWLNANTDWKPWRVVTFLMMSALWVLLDVVFLLFPFLCWFVVLITVWRLPYLVNKIWERQTSESFKDCDFAVKVTGWVISQAWGVVLDLLSIIFLLVPLVVTVHRLPTLWRAMKALGYFDLLKKNKIHGVLWEEVKKIGYCEPSEKQKLIAEIVA